MTGAMPYRKQTVYIKVG